MRLALVLAAVLAGLGWAWADNAPLTPTTSLAAETGNNTSAFDAFGGQPNGNAAAGNVSKLPVASLLYGGSTTRVYAHLMPWFGGANHANVGYNSADPAQVKRQVSDMMSRGIRGAIIDWYGPNFSRENTATQNMKAEAESRGGGFEFAVMEDVGALSACGAQAGCDIAGQVISDLTYAYNTFEASPAYMKAGGRPVVFFFGLEKYAIDWTRVRAGVAGNPLFIFRNSGAFAKAESDGGFSWVGLSSNALDMGLGYMDSFYGAGLTYPAKLTFGSGYKGFNDSIAAWAPSPPRVLDQQCGATWMKTLSEAGRYFSASNQLPAVQLVTWNDYEEGTAIEPGIENCVSISASVSGSALAWTVSGDENTLDHYTVFISADGQNLMPLGDVAAGTHTYGLSSLNFAPGNYQLFVKAVGKASLRNHMSGATAYTIAAPPPPPSGGGTTNADIAVAVASGTATVAGGEAGQFQMSVAPNASVSGAVSLSCQNLPQYASCSFSPGTFAAAGAAVNVTLKVSTSANSGAARRTPTGFAFWLTTPGFGLAGLVLTGTRKRRVVVASVLLVIALALVGCGGGQKTTTQVQPVVTTAGVTPSGSYTVTVVAAAGSVQKSATVTLVVR